MSTLSCVNPFFHSTDFINFSNNLISNATIYDPSRQIFTLNDTHMVKNENVFGPLIKPTPPTTINSIVKSSNPSNPFDDIWEQIFSNQGVREKGVSQQLSTVNKINMDSLLRHRRTSERPGYYCALCKKNGELPEFYRSHVLRDSSGKVVCPVLFNHVCEICGATGPVSHTRSYCPVLKQFKDSKPNDSKINILCSNSGAELNRPRNGHYSKVPFKGSKRQRFYTK